MSAKSTQSYADRASKHPNPLARALLNLAEKKKSNLVLSADVTTTAELLNIADRLGKHIVVLKTQTDIIDGFTYDTATQLSNLAKKHKFLIFEDRKFVDIGNTVQKQYAGGVYRIADWAHIVNACLLAGPGCVEGLARIASQHNHIGEDEEVSGQRGVLLLAEMTSAGSLVASEYVTACVQAARDFKESVIGFVATRTLTTVQEGRPALVGAKEDEDFLYFTTGINLDTEEDDLGQRYQTAESAVERGADFLIVGRGIYGASDVEVMAKRYKEVGWQAYLDRLQK